jgi:hypothetical protein
MIQSLSQKLMIGHFFAELPNLGISCAPAIIDVLDRVAQQSEWPAMADANPSPIRGRLSSLSSPPFRGRSRQMPESDQFIEQKT